MDHLCAKRPVEVVDLGTLRISPYDYEHRNRDDDFEPLMRRVLAHENILIASPVYWYAVSPPVKVFLDRITDYLDLPELLEDGRRLRGKTGYIVCTSIYDRVPAPFEGALTQTLSYLGMACGGLLHANCREGYAPDRHEAEVAAFAERLGTRTSREGC